MTSALVEHVEGTLPVSLKERRICRQGGAQNAIFFFRHHADDATFALVPGARRRLGWTPAPLPVTQAHRNSWQVGHQAHGESAVPLEQAIASTLSPARTVTIAPLLIEVRAVTAGQYIDSEIRDDEERSLHDILTLGVAKSAPGARLLSPDEWEHGCSGGHDALFRWGNEWPLCSPLGRGRRFAKHKDENAFGLMMGWNPHQPECVSSGELMKGGDGGLLMASGLGPVAAWVPFLTAYEFPLATVAERLFEYYELACVRRAIPIPGHP